MRRYRSLSAVVSAIAVFALVGGLLGRRLVAADDKVPDHYKAFTAALADGEPSKIFCAITSLSIAEISMPIP